jgi:UDP-2,4-diacetamido-2,4,6-trideoxy-beta-L-altropyranose hydrolase
MNKFYIRVDASNNIGIGHLIRCFTIAAYLKKKGHNPVFLTKSEHLKDSISSRGFEVEILSDSTVTDEISFIGSMINPKINNIIILDINNYNTFENVETYTRFIIDLKKLQLYVLAFEDFKVHPYPSDVVIIPYVGAEKINVSSKKSNFLIGPEYFVLSEQFSEVKKAVIAKEVSQIMISMGGSDASGITLNILESLNRSRIKAHLNVIMGQFSKTEDFQIRDSLGDYQGSYNIRRSVTNMAEIMCEADLAIINSGLTKYETASIGIPSIVISINDYHYEIMEEFTNFGSAVNIGIADNKIGNKVVDCIYDLTKDYEKRKRMSESGKALIDSNGIKRILSSIPSEIFANLKIANKMKCPACESLSIEKYIETDLTTFFFPVPEEVVEKIKQEPIKIEICKHCSHVFQVEVNKKTLDLIYGEFYSYYNLDTSVEFQEVYRERTIDFIKKVISIKQNNKILDIGCGEGTYFPFFQEKGYECFGFEPSKKANIAKEKNPDAQISDVYFESSKRNVFEVDFEVILMNWALEHILDIDSFFDKLESYLKIGTRLIIQVPDLQYYIDNNLALFYVHEHINYFTKESLSILLERRGFKIISTKNRDCPSLLICGEYTGKKIRRKINNSEFVELKKAFLSNNEELKENIRNLINDYEEIIIYGMGLVSYWISDHCIKSDDLNKIVLVDDNEYYQGKIVPSFNKKLTQYVKGHELKHTLIIISTSPVYYSKIKKVIGDRFTGVYSIATIESNRIVIENH